MSKNSLNSAFFLILLLAISAASFIGNSVMDFNAVFDTDAADHANAALEFYHAFLSFDFSEIYQAVIRQSFYPPVHSFFTLPAFLVFEPGYFSAILPSLVGYAGAALLLMLSVNSYYQHKFHGWQGFLIIILPALLLISSPINFFTSGLCMLEGISLLLFSLLLYLLINFEKQSNNIILFFLTLVLAALALSKYTLMVTILPSTAVVMFIAWRQKSITLKQLLLPTALLSALLTVWFLLIDFKSVLDFIFNQPPLKDGFWSYKSFFFYPQAFLNSHVVNPLLGLLVFLLVTMALYAGRATFLIKALGLIIFWSLLVFTLSSEKGSRHILFLMPAIFFLIPAGFAAIKSNLGRGAILISLYALLFWGVAQYLPKSEEYFARKIESARNSVKLYDFISQNIPKHSSILVDGLDDSLSLEGLRWHLALRQQQKYSEISADAYPFLAVTKSLALSHQRLVAKPFTDQSIPKKPLLAVLESSAYQYFIEIKSAKYQASQNQIKNLKNLTEAREYLDSRVFKALNSSKKLPEIVIYALE